MPTQDELRDLMPSIEVTEEELKRRKELEQKCDSLIAKIRGLEKTEIETLTEENQDLRAQLAAQEREMVELREQLAELEGIRAQINWQSEQDAEAFRERDEELAGLRERVSELLGDLHPNLHQTILQQRNELTKEVLNLRWENAQLRERLALIGIILIIKGSKP